MPPRPSAAADPAATIAEEKPTVCVVPSFAVTVRVFGEANAAVPWKTVIFRCFASPVSPPVSLSTAHCLKARTP